jgi:hypothetical protein
MEQQDLFETEAARSLLDQLLEDSQLYTQSKDYRDLLEFVVRLRNFAPFNAMLLQGFCRKVQMEASEVITLCDLCSQGVELFRGRLSRVSRNPQLSLANGMHDFHARDRTTGRPKRLKA